MRQPTSQIKIRLLRSDDRHHSNHGWLNSHASLSYADRLSVKSSEFSTLCVVNEDLVAPKSGFPEHPHAEFEIFSYIISGELTHRDSTLGSMKGGQCGECIIMRRGDVQFTTAGTGLTHSETNEHPTDTTQFLQIWVKPWKSRLQPRYHTRHFDDDAKRRGFVTILSPLKAGPEGGPEDEAQSEPLVPGTIPIHADFFMAAGIVKHKGTLSWKVGASSRLSTKRNLFIHIPLHSGSEAKFRFDSGEELNLREGDGVFVEDIEAGSIIYVEGVSLVETELVVLDLA
ncbi:RmlC-like cupin domain-containing protein [Ilyonectria sp. MPI-CAGE-AT-0026]|nr:RmlC-like cupin domain-containing protein [Ilyonectria sp. MPI-CAGE-AT-0026]